MWQTFRTKWLLIQVVRISMHCWWSCMHPKLLYLLKNNLIRMDYPMHECTSREGDHDDWRTEKRNDIWVPSRHWREMTAHVEQDGHPSSNERLLGPFVCAIWKRRFLKMASGVLLIPKYLFYMRNKKYLFYTRKKILCNRDVNSRVVRIRLISDLKTRKPDVKK
jgi:hypothetical protein